MLWQMWRKFPDGDLYFKWLELRWVSCLTRLSEEADSGSRDLLYESG